MYSLGNASPNPFNAALCDFMATARHLVGIESAESRVIIKITLHQFIGGFSVLISTNKEEDSAINVLAMNAGFVYLFHLMPAIA